MKLNKKFTQLATAIVTTATLAGCASMDPYDSGRLGGAVGGAVGVGMSEAFGGSTSDTGRVIRAVGLGYLGREAGTAIGKSMGGNCDRDVIIDNRAGAVTRDVSNCDIHHRTPPGTPRVIYPR